MKNKKTCHQPLAISNQKLWVGSCGLGVKLFILVLTFTFSLITVHCFSQVGVGINTTGTAADHSAILDVSSTTQGTLISRMTTSQRDAIVSPANSLLIFNTTTRCYEGYDAADLTWISFGCFGCSVPSMPSAITGTGTVCKGQSGVTFSVSNVSGISYIWTYSGTGFTIGSGSGTSSISANFSASATSGTLSVTGSNACGSGTAQTLAITVNDLPVAPTSGTHTPSVNQIIWNWSTVSGATGYQWNTSSTYPGVGANAIANPTYTQTGLSGFTSYTLFVWAYNICGNSTVITLTSSTTATGTQVYNALTPSPNGTNNRVITGVGFSPDLMFLNHRTGGGFGTAVVDRLRGMPWQLMTYSDNGEWRTQYDAGQGPASFDADGFTEGNNDSQQWNYSAGGYTNVFHFFRRATGFLDVVLWTGNLNHVHTHSLGVTPQLIFEKSRSTTENWVITYVPNNTYSFLNTTNAFAALGGGNIHNETQFSTGMDTPGTTYVAYLFATLPGVSKVGSYTGNGISQTIACGFSTSARFILIKRADSAGDWYVWDTARGIVLGNDPHISLNSAASAEVTSDNSITSDPSGFIVNQVAATNINVTSATYVFLAIN